MLLPIFFLITFFPHPFIIKELEKSDANAEELKRKAKGQQRTQAPVSKVSRQAPKNPRKNSKKVNNVETQKENMDTSSSSALETGRYKFVSRMFYILA